MAIILSGAEVAASINEKTSAKVEDLKARGISPTLCIFRVGERVDDLSYEKMAIKKCEKLGVALKNVRLPEDVDQETFDEALKAVNEDAEIHGILLFRPLPAQLDDEKARQMLKPEKDIDGCTDGSLAGVFTNTKKGFPPCTAQAAMEILHHYEIPIARKSAAVIGRSLVVGRPVSMMLMHENATVTTCHTKTPDPSAVAKDADILIAAAGRLHSVGPEFTNENQVIIDVGINWDENAGKISGDVDLEKVEPLCKAITPVPGGVGTVTTSVLISHVAEAAARTIE